MTRRAPTLETKSGYRKVAGRPRPDPERVNSIVELLDEHYGAPTCALDHDTPFQLLVATILSAQCTDERVNKVTPALFARFPDASSMSRAEQADVEELVRSTGFFRNKAKNIIGAAKGIMARHGGEVPRTLEELVGLPGVARKTANVVMGTSFGIPSGVVVDTHVARLTRHWDFHALEDPVRIEKCLQSLLPEERWISFSHQVIWHGRGPCKARRPACEECPFVPVCPRGQKAVSP